MDKLKVAINRLNSTVGDIEITLTREVMDDSLRETIEHWAEQINIAVNEIRG